MKYIGAQMCIRDSIYPVDNVIVRAVGILNETREND